MIVASEDRVTPWRDFDGHEAVAVRIWGRMTPFGMFQRHEWRRPDGSSWREGWIPAAGRRWPAGAAPTLAEDDESAQTLSPEEWELLAEHFSGANDPVAQSILAKAQAALS